ncbi:hypothetical protein [Haloimpatiens lingqiaonensis]|uniref:hypothetical protein n=1 Tax=Haloimpatiens lingqiaonensis TaxID=1380675 RepID=UPI0010FF44AC|nr:hypothetical protein [Haloimpatiens lingqiaonensis]
MKDKVKRAKIAVIISGLALVISSISLIFSIVTGISRASAITIFCCTITILGVNLSDYKSKKNNNNNSSKQM